jgi:hypothetical protein
VRQGLRRPVRNAWSSHPAEVGSLPRTSQRSEKIRHWAGSHHDSGSKSPKIGVFGAQSGAKAGTGAAFDTPRVSRRFAQVHRWFIAADYPIIRSS